ncbi:GNAT family N-acetyltransferase [Mycobacterium gordonae]|uniref:GNAT family N-acetyltransferase n=1 Tax=Mycobacterium gordonae TaxID=1778 RepID=UPI0006E46E9C|nr:GNAT family N-acetyltransferase [Mycobacterium gordonae]
MKIVVHDLSGPEIERFLDDHIQEMRDVTPPDSKHALDIDGLRMDNVTFWVVLDDGGVIIGTGALKRLGPVEGEIKSMRTTPERKRSGIASALLNHIVDYARQQGLQRLSLETGSTPFFEPARQLYLKHGFWECGPFGEYTLDPYSQFFTLNLAANDASHCTEDGCV